MGYGPIYIPTFISSVTYQPARVLPRIYFYNSTRETDKWYLEGFATNSTSSIVTQETNQFPYFDHYSGNTPTSESISLLFNNEATPYGEAPTGSLYTEYWENYVELLYNPKTRLLNCSAIIPLADYFDMELNDVVNFRGNYYHLRAINDYNLSTGECNLQLLGPIIPDALEEKIQFNGIITNGLGLYLDAGNPNSYPGTGTTWNSLVGLSSGSLRDGPTFSNEYGGSIVFDGVNDYVSVIRFPDLNFSPTSSFSMTVWAKVNSITAGLTGTVFARGAGANSYGIAVNRSVGGTYSWQVGSRAVSTLQTLVPLTPGVVDCITYVRTPSNQFIYKNGALQATLASTSSGSFDAASYNIMSNQAVPSGTGGWPAGSVYSATIYTRALSAEEVAYNYNITKVRFGL